MLATMPFDKKLFLKVKTHLLAEVHIIARRATTIRFNCIIHRYQVTTGRLLDKCTIDSKVYFRKFFN